MAESGNTGIYEIVNLVNGKRYIGSAASFPHRWYAHRWKLNRDRHHSFKLQRAWRKYGSNIFEFRTIELCSIENLILREQYFIDTLLPSYNVAKHARGGGGGRGVMSEDGKRRVAEACKRRVGFKHSPETRAKISAAKRGHASTKGQKRARSAVEKTAAAHRGMKRTEETRAKLSAAMLGSKKPPRSLEHRLRLSAAHKGRAKSAEHMAALQEGRRRRIYTAEQRDKLSVHIKSQYESGIRSRSRSDEYRANISKSLTGRTLSPEHRANVAAAMRGKKRGPYKTSK